jgi:hypothetical protein
MSVDAMPDGFKFVDHEFGEAFYCEACERPADTSYPTLSRGPC